jgi:hypothetical protein
VATAHNGERGGGEGEAIGGDTMVVEATRAAATLAAKNPSDGEGARAVSHRDNRCISGAGGVQVHVVVGSALVA